MDTVEEFRARHQVAQVKNLDQRQAGILSTLIRWSLFGSRTASEARAMRRCGDPYPCRSRYCHRCSGYRRSPRRQRYPYSPGVKVDPRVISVPPHLVGTYRNRGALSILGPLVGLPTKKVFAVTVNFCWCETDDLSEVSKYYRSIIRKIFDKSLPRNSVHGRGTIISGKMDFVIKPASEANNPNGNYASLPFYSRAQGPSTQKQLAMFHAHFLIYHPNASEDRIKRILKSAFPGAYRVRLEPIRAEVHRNGRWVSGGALGYAQYTSIEKLELKFRNKNIDALKLDMGFHNSWKRANANIRYGTRAVRVVSIHGIKRSLPFLNLNEPFKVSSVKLFNKLGEIVSRTKNSFINSFINWLTRIGAKLPGFPGLRKPFDTQTVGTSMTTGPPTFAPP